jgi:SAM-dependent methyltransferase
MSGAPARDQVIWHDVECGGYAADLGLWSELAEESGGERCDLLELGCGTGRVSLPLAALKHSVTALDLDPSLVAELERRAGDHGVDVETVVADARSFALGRTFDLVLAPMQIVQLMHGTEERTAMLARIRTHLRPGGLAALSLLDFKEEDWTALPGEAPLPDMREEDKWVYASVPVAVRRVEDGGAILLERIRKTVSPDGDEHEERESIRLELVHPEQLEREAVAVGLEPLRSKDIPPTDDHVGSTVVILRRAAAKGGRS